MIKTLSLLVAFLFLSVTVFSIFPSISYAETVVTEIDSEAAARNLAVKAEGTYVEGAAAPTLSGSEVALPIIDEASGEILGHIILGEIGCHCVLDAAADSLDPVRLRRIRARLIFIQELVVLEEACGKHIRIRDERELTPSGKRNKAAKLEKKRRNQKGQ